MDKKQNKRKSIKKKIKDLKIIKERVPKIVFKARNIIVTLRSEGQLKKWLEAWPDGKYEINY